MSIDYSKTEQERWAELIAPPPPPLPPLPTIREITRIVLLDAHRPHPFAGRQSVMVSIKVTMHGSCAPRVVVRALPGASDPVLADAAVASVKARIAEELAAPAAEVSTTPWGSPVDGFDVGAFMRTPTAVYDDLARILEDTIFGDY